MFGNAHSGSANHYGIQNSLVNEDTNWYQHLLIQHEELCKIFSICRS